MDCEPCFKDHHLKSMSRDSQNTCSLNKSQRDLAYGEDSLLTPTWP